MKVKAQWTDDCNGKKDFDSEIVGLSSRYWPLGGGFREFDTVARKFIDLNLDIKPSASSEIYIATDEGDVTLAVKEFEGGDFEDVSAQVEAWVQEQMNRIVGALKKEFKI